MINRMLRKMPDWLRRYLIDTFTNRRTEKMSDREWWDFAGW